MNDVCFRILGQDFQPYDVSCALGMDATLCFRKGDFRQGNPRCFPYEQNGWIINSDVPYAEELEVHLLALLERLSDHSGYLRTISENNFTQFHCDITGDIREEWLHVSAPTLQKISDIGAGLCVITYADADEPYVLSPVGTW